MNSRHIALLLLFFLLLALLVAGCAQVNSEVGTAGSSGVAGFGSGFWHGLILPVSFIVSLFDDSIGIYEIHNNGNWYNFGFVFGAWVVFVAILAPKQGYSRKGKS